MRGKKLYVVVGEGKNRREWRKGKVVHFIGGKYGVVRGTTLLHKGHTIERPLQLIYPLEIRAVEPTVQPYERRREQNGTKSQEEDELQLEWLLRELQNNRKQKTIEELNCLKFTWTAVMQIG